MNELTGSTGGRPVPAMKSAPATKAVKKAAAKKAAKKAAPVKKAAAKKAPAKKAPAKKAAKKAAPAKKAAKKSASDNARSSPRRALSAPPTDPLVVLALREPFSAAQLRRAWRDYAAIHHPDAGGDAAMFSRGRQAYLALRPRAAR